MNVPPEVTATAMGALSRAYDTGARDAVPPAVRAAISAIVDYNWDDEKHDSAEHPDDGEAHIFASLQRVRQWLDQPRG